MDFWTLATARRLRNDPLGDFLQQLKSGSSRSPTEPASLEELKAVLRAHNVRPAGVSTARLWRDWSNRNQPTSSTARFIRTRKL